MYRFLESYKELFIVEKSNIFSYIFEHCIKIFLLQS